MRSSLDCITDEQEIDLELQEYPRLGEPVETDIPDRLRSYRGLAVGLVKDQKKY